MPDGARPIVRYTEVTLTPSEMLAGLQCGVARHFSALKKASKNAYGKEDDPYEGLIEHINGALGEIAAAKATGRFWTAGVDTYDAPDVGKRIQVRTRSRHDWDLMIREKDKDAEIFILATGQGRHFRIHGWIWARHARCDRYLRNYGGRPPAWFVPQSALRPLSELPPDDESEGVIMGVTWKSRLVWRDDERAYKGIVSIAGFPYEMKITRDWMGDEKAVECKVSVWDGPEKYEANSR